MKTVKFQLEPLTCPSCIKKIEGKLGKMNGVGETKVMFNSSKVKATFDAEQVTAEELQKTIEKLGYPVLSSKIV
ncbi:heavy metal-binding protein [Virgibacillus indicus]|uniref:Heavy metal-binding protein n=1 Tax=Virgibacillus indicus TaxID=2024554 RepID=A0A265NAT9_9BACI|nr:heavy-metal-associated domain-containing protein [Virgibacillus indicus]OZU88947.1 heavy metal-binding protein [Virgibacillus indicus]